MPDMPILRTTITASPRPVLISDPDRPAEPADRVLEVDDDQASKSSSASAETGTD